MSHSIQVPQFQKGRCFFRNLHASLEWEQCDIFKTLGISIGRGNFDRSHTERPEIPGYNDSDFGEDIRSRLASRTLREEDFEGCNFVYAMNSSEFQHEIPHLAEFRPVVFHLFGQWIEIQLDEFAGKMNKQAEMGLRPNIFVVCYVKREKDYLQARLREELKKNVFHIRFAKRPEIYNPWVVKDRCQKFQTAGWGEKEIDKFNEFIGFHRKPPVRLPFVFTSSNSIHKRGEGCGWPQLEAIRNRNLPHILSGNETNEVKGTGRMSFDQLKTFMWSCGAYVSFPAWPAPLVMNIMEAQMAGAPVAFYENARGCAEEGMFDGEVGCLSSDVEALYGFCERCVKDSDFRERQSKLSIERAMELYDFNKVIHQWAEVFQEVSKFW